MSQFLTDHDGAEVNEDADEIESHYKEILTNSNSTTSLNP